MFRKEPVIVDSYITVKTYVLLAEISGSVYPSQQLMIHWDIVFLGILSFESLEIYVSSSVESDEWCAETPKYETVWVSRTFPIKILSLPSLEILDYLGMSFKGITKAQVSLSGKRWRTAGLTSERYWEVFRELHSWFIAPSNHSYLVDSQFFRKLISSW